MNKRRPVNLDLTTIQFPLPAIVSILHRISGLVLFFLIPLMLNMLSHSLTTVDSFQALLATFEPVWLRILAWFMLAALVFHLIAGTRHLLMDVGVGESLAGGRLSAKLTLLFFVLVMFLVGFWLC